MIPNVEFSGSSAGLAGGEARNEWPVTSTPAYGLGSRVRHSEGATVTEQMELTGWQAHSARGFLSGTAKKKLELTVERIAEDGRTDYRVPSVSAGD